MTKRASGPGTLGEEHEDALLGGNRPRRRRGLTFAALLAAAVIVFIVVWFQPQALFVDKRVDEGLPGLTEPPRGSSVPGATPGQGRATTTKGSRPKTSPKSPAPAPRDATTGGGTPAPAIIASGNFRSLEHETTGRALLVRLADGRHILRFENLRTSNGPDLRVYLSEIPASDDWRAYRERFVDLGALRGNIGNQNYDVPTGIDLSRYRSAVIWCRRFSVGFGVAPLDR